MFIQNAFEQGGVFMYFILVFGLLTVAFIAERIVALYARTKATAPEFHDQLAEFIRRDDLEGAEKLAARHAAKQPFARIAEVAFSLRARRAGDEELQARMDERLSDEIGAIEKRTGFLAMFGNVATLVGLLGTIGGMIVSFAGVADANPADRATMLSKGISHALNCTGFGLLVAIPALVFFAVLQNRTDQLVKALVNSTTSLYHDLLFMTEGRSIDERAEGGRTKIERARRNEEIRA